MAQSKPAENASNADAISDLKKEIMSINEADSREEMVFLTRKTLKDKYDVVFEITETSSTSNNDTEINAEDPDDFTFY